MTAGECNRIDIVQPGKETKRLALHHQFLEKASAIFKTVRSLAELQKND
jgi:hypothetical protein